MIRRFSPGALTLLLIVATARADDWPQFRGPDRNGVSKEKGLLTAWPKEGPKLLWKYKDAGLGFSSLAVVGDMVYLSGTRNDKEEIVIALKDGKVLWTAPIGPLFTFQNNKWGDGPRGTPTIDGNFLYALGGQGDLICLDLTAKGTKEVWRKNLIKDFEGKMMSQWGNSESPLIDGNLLICTPGDDKGTVAALDKKTGQVKWRSTELKNLAPYSSIIAADIQGVRQYIVNSYVNGIVGGVISGISAKDGAVLWTMPTFKMDKYAISPSPIVKDNFVYNTVGEGGGCHLFEIDKNMKAKDKYKKANQKVVKNTHGGVVLVGDHIYGHTEKNDWVCQDFATGELAWAQPAGEECFSGSIIAAGDMLYLYSDQGDVILLKADPKAWTEAGRFVIPEKSAYPQKRNSSKGSKVWSNPAIANGRLYLRDCEFVYCYDISAKK